MVFLTTLVNVLIALFYMLPGFVIGKMKKGRVEHLPTLSAVLVYIGTPFLEISAFMSLEFSWHDLANMGIFFVLTLLFQTIFMLLIYLVFRKKYFMSKYRLLTIGSVMGNVGFFGLPVVKAIFPDHPEVACYSAVFMVSLNVLVFTVGVFCLTGDKKYISLRSAILNPNVFGLVLALPFYFFSLKDYLPDALLNGIQVIGNMTAPLCMFILGIRLAATPLKRIFSCPMVYVIAAMKLLVFPLFCYAIALLLPLDPLIQATILVLSATPCAAVLQSQAEMHDSEAEMAANCILMSTLLCFITIPLLTLLL